MSAGKEWWLRFLRAHNVTNERAWYAIGCRESGPDSQCVYPEGAPWGDWEHGNGRHFDVGTVQVNDRHLDDLIRLGYGADMRCMLDAEKNLDFALKHLSWSDWGIRLTPDGKSYSFDWTGWPAPYRPGMSGAVSAEFGFKTNWDEYPSVVKRVLSTPVKKKMTVRVMDVQQGKKNFSVRLVQTALNKALNATLTVDGEFGPKTQLAYDKYRSQVLGWKGMEAVGAVGLSSLTALGKVGGFLAVP